MRCVARRDSRQAPLFPVTSFIPKPYERFSLYDILARFGEFLFRRSDFPAAEPALGGQTGWCPVQLSKLVVLQAKHGWTDRETVQRGAYDLQVKACLGLGIESKGPSQPTLCRHRQRMQELGLDEVYLERLQGVLEALELVDKKDPVLIDSVPIEGAGQQLDTYNLLAAAVRQGVKALATRRQADAQSVASELGLERYLERTVKGRFEVDWEQEASRAAFLGQLVADARKVRSALLAPVAPEEDSRGDGGPPTVSPPRSVDGPQTPSTDSADGGAARRVVTIIDEVLEHDVDFDAQGEVRGIVQRPAGDRLISATDLDMRHGRKSASQLIQGFKAQVIATAAFGFILLTRVFAANRHDGEDLPALATELQGRGFEPEWWAGDHAYGTIANHAFFHAHSGELVARMARPANGGRYTKDSFQYSFEDHSLTCPAGHTLVQIRWETSHGKKGRRFDFTEAGCASCPHRAQCVSPKAAPEKGRTVFIIDDEERLIRDHLERRKHSEFRARLAQRPAVERVISGFAQCGGKNARRFGMRHVAFDANLSALAYNLRRLGSLLATRDELVERLRAFGALVGALRRLRRGAHRRFRWLSGLLRWARRQPTYTHARHQELRLCVA